MFVMRSLLVRSSPFGRQAPGANPTALMQAPWDWANQRLAEADTSDLLVIDELGPVEFFQGKGLLAGMDRLDQGDYRIACVVVRSALLPNALQRWPNAIVVNGGIKR